jgi:hypothetical protein
MAKGRRTMGMLFNTDYTLALLKLFQDRYVDHFGDYRGDGATWSGDTDSYTAARNLNLYINADKSDSHELNWKKWLNNFDKLKNNDGTSVAMELRKEVADYLADGGATGCQAIQFFAVPSEKITVTVLDEEPYNGGYAASILIETVTVDKISQYVRSQSRHRRRPRP